MGSPVILAYCGAAAIAMASAVFGVGIARLIWAEDLTHARRIDELRSQTETHLRSQIKSMERIIEMNKPR